MQSEVFLILRSWNSLPTPCRPKNGPVTHHFQEQRQVPETKEPTFDDFSLGRAAVVHCCVSQPGLPASAPASLLRFVAIGRQLSRIDALPTFLTTKKKEGSIIFVTGTKRLAHG
jgi:hypothetical protein